MIFSFLNFWVFVGVLHEALDMAVHGLNLIIVSS